MSSEGIITLQKSLFSHTFLSESSLLFFSKNEHNLDYKNHHYSLMSFLLTIPIIFLLQDDYIVILWT